MRHERSSATAVHAVLAGALVGGPAELLGAALLRPDLIFDLRTLLWIAAVGCACWAALGAAVEALVCLALRLARARADFYRGLALTAPAVAALSGVAAVRAVQALGGGGAWATAMALGLPLLLGLALWLAAAALVSRLSIGRRWELLVTLIVLLGAAALLRCGLLAAPNRSTAGGHSVVLVTLDTVRVDRLGLYGASDGLSPNLDRLAESSIVFDLAYCTQPETTPSHATILTGLEPLNHGVWRGNGFRLRSGVTTLAEMFGSAGFHSAAFVSGYPLDRAFGLDQGFAMYDDAFSGPLWTFIAPFALVDLLRARLGSYVLERDGAATVDAARRWLRQAEEPFFLWVHLYDPHHPYLDPTGGLPSDQVAALNERWFEGAELPGDEREVRRLYDRELAYADAQLGRLIDELQARGLFDGALLAVIGDHGEGLGDHGYKWHSERLNEELVRVPLLIRLPYGSLGGRRLPILTRTADLAPTLYELALPNAFVPATMDGADLSPAFSGEIEEAGEPVLMLTRKGLTAGTDGEFKLIYPEGAAGPPQAFDLPADPGESSPLRSIPSECLPLAERTERFGELVRRTLAASPQ